MQSTTAPLRKVQNETQSSEVRLTAELIFAFKDWLLETGLPVSTAERYEAALRQIKKRLPKDRVIQRGTLQQVRERLLEEEYAPTTINLYICAANRFVEYCGRRELQLVGDLPRDNLEQPELSRAEYLKLLVAARRLNRHRDYLLIKLFATTGIALSEVVKLTTLAVRQGKLDVCQNRIHKSMPIPSGLQTELLDYARAEGRVAGPIFITKNGNLLNRSSIRNSIAALAKPAGLPREKCNPLCLRKLYQTTQQEIEDSFAELVKRTFNDMIDKEQILIG